MKPQPQLPPARYRKPHVTMRRQGGATLMIALILLSVILLLGAASTALLLLEEHAARNHREYAQAHLAAQAALDDACEDLMQRRRIRPAQFDGTSGCLAGNDTRGLCLGRAHSSAWQPQQLTPAAHWMAPYGHYTGRRTSSSAAIPSPRYLIERLQPSGPRAGAALVLYRLVAIGYGRGDATVALQAVVQQADPDPAAQDAAPPAVNPTCPLLAWRLLFVPVTR